MSILNKKLYNAAYKLTIIKKKTESLTKSLNYCWLIEVMNTNGWKFEYIFKLFYNKTGRVSKS